MYAAGMGRHFSCLPDEDKITFLEFSALSEAINVIGIGISKVSVCLMLLRIVEGVRRKTRQFLWALLAIVVASHLALALIFFLHCRPLAALWNPHVEGACMSTEQTVLAGYVGFAFDIITDLVCALLPIMVISKLRMNRRPKIALCVLMGLGVFTAGCAVAKALSLRGVFGDNPSDGFLEPATWAAVEQFLGIIIVSLPALRPLFGRMLHSAGSGLNHGKRLLVGKNLSSKKPSWLEKGPSARMHKKRGSETQASQSSERTLMASASTSQQTSADPTPMDPMATFKKDIEKGADEGNYLNSWSLPDDRHNRLSAVLRIPDRIYRPLSTWSAMKSANG